MVNLLDVKLFSDIKGSVRRSSSEFVGVDELKQISKRKAFSETQACESRRTPTNSDELKQISKRQAFSETPA